MSCSRCSTRASQRHRSAFAVIGTDVSGTGNVGHVDDGVDLIGVIGNEIENDVICFNGGVGILGHWGSSDQNN
jgi:hypothetical protein